MLGGATKNSFLSHVKENVYCTASRPPVTDAVCREKGTISEFLERIRGTVHEPTAQAILLNTVKLCPTCGKPNGSTLSTCNRCQRDLSQTAVSFTNNLFSAFVLGIEREPKFPLTLSMRLENERVMVFDDPLALSPLHFCAIPTTVYIPDWRYLALQPKVGLAISQELVQSCHSVAVAQFLSDPNWRRSLLKSNAIDVQDAVMGYNFPPSQNQLHVQYMLPLLMPHQYMMFLRGVHFTTNRFFPVSFVDRCLRQLVDCGTQLQRSDLELPIEELLAVLKQKCGVDYEEEHTALLKRVDRQQKELANWKEESFGGICRVPESGKGGDLVFESFTRNEEHSKTFAEHAVYEREKRVLQNYAKSGGQSQSSMGYYSHPKAIDELDMSFLSA